MLHVWTYEGLNPWEHYDGRTPVADMDAREVRPVGLPPVRRRVRRLPSLSPVSRSVPRVEEPKRLSIAGIHHITLIVADAERAVAFYRNVLGMRLVDQGVNDDDPDARHLIFGDADGRPGTLVTCLEYPQLEPGRVGVGSTHHFALSVDSLEELQAWRDYLVSQNVACTEVLERSFAKSVYMRDPDGHIVELATSG